MWVDVASLQNTSGRFYVGHTDDLDRRLREHSEPEGKFHLGKYTHKNGHRLV